MIRRSTQQFGFQHHDLSVNHSTDVQFAATSEALRPNGVLVVLDLVRSSGFVERVMDVVGLGVSASQRLIHNRRLQPAPEVRKAWEQHGKHGHYSTVTQMHALADEVLPGTTMKRCLLWRYLLVYKKPATE